MGFISPISGTRGVHPVILFVNGFKGFKDWGAFPAACEELAYVLHGFDYK